MEKVIMKYKIEDLTEGVCTVGYCNTMKAVREICREYDYEVDVAENWSPLLRQFDPASGKYKIYRKAWKY